LFHAKAHKEQRQKVQDNFAILHFRALCEV
jgi:hypothetical protein